MPVNHESVYHLEAKDSNDDRHQRKFDFKKAKGLNKRKERRKEGRRREKRQRQRKDRQKERRRQKEKRKRHNQTKTQPLRNYNQQVMSLRGGHSR